MNVFYKLPQRIDSGNANKLDDSIAEKLAEYSDKSTAQTHQKYLGSIYSRSGKSSLNSIYKQQAPETSKLRGYYQLFNISPSYLNSPCFS